MIDLKFALRKARGTNYKAIIDTAVRVSKKSGKPAPMVLIDLVYCIIKYEAGLVDYEDFKMYNMSGRQRENVLTIGKNLRICRRLNDSAKLDTIEDKMKFNQYFSKFLKRDWLYLTKNEDEDLDKLKAFLNGKNKVIVKPIDQTCGIGISIIDIDENTDVKALYQKLLRDNTPLLEEVIVQSQKMNELAPYTVDTIRIISVLNGDKVTPVASGLRMGTKGNVVDNFHHGGISACINPRNGRIVTDGFDKEGNVYVRMPGTGALLKGRPVPFWDKAVAMVTEAHRMIPDLRYVGWDVAINQYDEPLLIEANDLPANDLSQRPELNIGTYGEILKALGEK